MLDNYLSQGLHGYLTVHGVSFFYMLEIINRFNERNPLTLIREGLDQIMALMTRATDVLYWLCIS